MKSVSARPSTSPQVKPCGKVEAATRVCYKSSALPLGVTCAEAASVVSTINPLVDKGGVRFRTTLVTIPMPGAGFQQPDDGADTVAPIRLDESNHQADYCQRSFPVNPVVMPLPHLAELVLDFFLQTIYQRLLKSKLPIKKRPLG